MWFFYNPQLIAEGFVALATIILLVIFLLVWRVAGFLRALLVIMSIVVPIVVLIDAISFVLLMAVGIGVTIYALKTGATIYALAMLPWTIRGVIGVTVRVVLSFEFMTGGNSKLSKGMYWICAEHWGRRTAIALRVLFLISFILVWVIAWGNTGLVVASVIFTIAAVVRWADA